jgi:glucosamine--fructose-6-phosphate aminotransferase (isomerizing)
MCGIVGYVGPQQATPILLGGLQRVEYRGYDSAGIAVISPSGELLMRKAAGKLKNLQSWVATLETEGGTGIGHTRWATHGRPNDENAHPHVDCTGDLMVIHNGIIENYAELRDDLLAKGHVFSSETDTETVAHLIEETLRSVDDLHEATRLALAQLSGAYAIVVISRNHPGRLVGARLNAPMIVGLGEGENFLASDIAAILAHTRRMVVLDEAEIAEITANSFKITTLDGVPVSHDEIHVDWDTESAEKGGFAHFFVKEIHEQPEALTRALTGRVLDEAGGLTLRLAELDRLAASGALEKVTRVVILGCGSSVLAAQLARYAIERWSRIPVEVAVASEFRYADPIAGPETLVIAVTQSGETADTIAATRLARERGAPIVAITNVVGSAITRAANETFYLQAGPEISVTSTKTFITTTTVLSLIGLWLGRRAGSLIRDELQETLEALRALPAKMRRVLEQSVSEQVHYEATAAWLAGCESCMFIGRGAGYPVAAEGALKLKEISYVHAEAYPAGELKHGPIALLDPKTPLVAIATRSRTYDKVISNVEEVRAREARVLAIATEGDAEIARHADDVYYVPDAPEALAPLLAIIPLQLISYHVALARGTDVDQPRNLAKSVTVE